MSKRVEVKKENIQEAILECETKYSFTPEICYHLEFGFLCFESEEDFKIYLEDKK
jgi:hypothetical protein